MAVVIVRADFGAQSGGRSIQSLSSMGDRKANALSAHADRDH